LVKFPRAVLEHQIRLKKYNCYYCYKPLGRSTRTSACGRRLFVARARYSLAHRCCHAQVICPPVRSHRAGFSLSRALFRKKCGAPHLWRQTLFFLEKKLAPFFSHQRLLSVLQCHPYLFSPKKLATFFCSSLSLIFHFTRSLECRPLFRACCCVAKNLPLLLWGPLLCGGSCSAEHAEHA